MLQTGAEDRFKFYSGVPCLDFLVTLRGRKEERRETLLDFHDLVDWCEGAGLLSDKDARQFRSLRPRGAEVYVRRSIALREILYRIMKAAATGRSIPARDLAWLNRLLRQGKAYSQVGLDKRGKPFKETVTILRGAPWLLYLIAKSAIDLLTSQDFSLLRACGNTRCAVLYVDRSKNHTRRWCSMARCGNLTKVTRFYARKRAEHRRRSGPNGRVKLGV